MDQHWGRFPVLQEAACPGSFRQSAFILFICGLIVPRLSKPSAPGVGKRRVAFFATAPDIAA